MNAEIAASTVGGATAAPPSKSYTHRAILAAGLGEGRTKIAHPLVSADTRATVRAIEAFGGMVEERNDALVIEGFGRPETPETVIDCANSGTTMRLTTALAALADNSTVLTGDESLRARPQGPLLDAIERLGGRAESTRRNGRAPLVVGGPVSGGTVTIPGNVSSQFVSALLLAGARMEGGTEIALETGLKSAPYVAITREVLSSFGVDSTRTNDGFAVAGDQPFDASGHYRVPGDFSSASYLLAAGVLAADEGLEISGLFPSAQGDSTIVGYLERMGADISWDRDAGTITVECSPLSGIEIDVGDTPDLLPTLAVLGTVADGETRLVNAEHVRYKETDRVSAMADELDRLGARVTERPDSLTIHGSESTLRGARVDGRQDHRVVMALAVCGLVAEGTTTIEGAEHVDVSFPGFFDALRDLGAGVTLG